MSRHRANGTSATRVVVIGAGFGGLEVAHRLRRADVDVLIIDRNNFHTFQPLLYQVATAGLEPEEIAHAVRGIVQKQRNCSFRLGEVEHVDWEAKSVVLDGGHREPYDYLVIAAGATTNFFGVPGAEERAFGVKYLEEAVALRSHIIRQFETADRDPSHADRGGLNFVIVGGGATGVEVAGALVELFDLVFAKDFPGLAHEKARVILIEALPTLLTNFHESSSKHAVETLRKRGVTLIFGDRVTRVDDQAVHLAGGTVLPTQTLIWATGVRAEGLADRLGVEQTGAGRIVVNDDLSIPGRPCVFAIGDISGGKDADGDLYPQVAPVAIQQGKHVAAQIRRTERDEPTRPFQFKDPGQMATIGRNAAVTELGGGIRARGFIAWVMWLALHLVMLIGFRNRLNVLINWAWNYFTYDRSARLIFSADLARKTDSASGGSGHAGVDDKAELIS